MLNFFNTVYEIQLFEESNETYMHAALYRYINFNTGQNNSVSTSDEFVYWD